MSELSCDTLFIGRNETHDLSRYHYEDEDELKLTSAQHARSAASRLDDVIDRSALECPLSTEAPVWTSLGLRDGKEPQRLIYYESSSLCSSLVTQVTR